MTEENLDPLARAMGEALEACLKLGFELPLHAVAVGLNGSVLAVRYVAAEGGGLAAQPLAEYFENAQFTAPVNIMIVDASGEAARVIIGPDGKAKLLN